MKRHGNLFEQIIRYPNMERAYHKARNGHRYDKTVLDFELNRESNLFDLIEELKNKTYETGKYRDFYITDPKRRLISALPFRDRIIHHALCNLIEPIFDRVFIFDSYACRVNKGTHKGITRLQNFIRARSDSIYVLKCDIRKYFYSINNDILKSLIRKKIKCPDTLWLIDEIINSNHQKIGIPLGNLTSQLFANIYLNSLDHYVKEILHCEHYIRYMDDFVILSNNKSQLWEILSQINKYLVDELHLQLNGKTKVFPLSQGIDFLGYRQYQEFRLLRKRNVIKNKRKFRKYSRQFSDGMITFEKIHSAVQSLIGYAKWAQSYHARKNILSNIVLRYEALS